jgi:hypothetical protein
LLLRSLIALQKFQYNAGKKERIDDVLADRKARLNGEEAAAVLAGQPHLDSMVSRLKPLKPKIRLVSERAEAITTTSLRRRVRGQRSGYALAAGADGPRRTAVIAKGESAAAVAIA